MNYYKIDTNIDCTACLDGTLISMLYEKELFDSIYYDGEVENNTSIVCMSTLDSKELDDFIQDTFAVGFEISIETIAEKQFQQIIKLMKSYTKSFFENDETKPKIIRNIFDCSFSDANNQHRFIHELHSGRISGYMYAGLSEQGNVYLGYPDYINEGQLEGVISEIKSLIEPYGGIFNQ